MDENKVNLFVLTMGKLFPNNKLLLIKEKLENSDDSKLILVQSMDYKDPTTLLLFSIFLGHFGVDRFMLGQVGIGIVKLLTLGGCGIWTIIDWFLISDLTKKWNLNLFLTAI